MFQIEIVELLKHFKMIFYFFKNNVKYYFAMMIDLKKILIWLIIVIPLLFLLKIGFRSGGGRAKRSFTKKSLQKFLEKYIT